MRNKSIGLLLVHIAVLLFGFSGLFPKILNLSSLTIVTFRVLFAFLTIGLILYLKKEKINLSKKSKILLISSGFILAIHWLTFFYSIQVSTISIGLFSFSTFPIFILLIEPFITKEKFDIKTLITGFLIIFGVYFIIPDFSLRNTVFIGVLSGVLSAILYAVLFMINKQFVKKISFLQIAFFQNFFAFVCLLPFFLIKVQLPSITEFAWLTLLGVVLTAGAHTLMISGLKFLRTGVAGVINCLEMVYAILLAMIFFNDIPDFRTWIGGLIIFGSAFYISLTENSNK